MPIPSNSLRRCWQDVMWIHERGQRSDLKVQMWTTRVTGRADGADHIALPHTLTTSDIDGAQMSVERLEIIPMVNHDHVAITVVIPTGVYNHTSVCGIHCFAQVACNINAKVVRAGCVIKP